MPPCVHIENLTKRYGGTIAVENLSFTVERGDVFGVLGPNGAGKSTTLYMLCGLIRPTAGEISIFAKDLHANFLEIMPRVGVLVERPAFYDHLSVAKNLLILCKLASRNVTIDRALDLVGLLYLADEKVGTLSLGLRQRLGLAQAFLTEPELLILDEPTNGLDVENAQEILKLLRRLASEAQVTIILSSHAMHEVESLCDRVAIINEGKLITCDETDALLSFDQTVIEVLIDAPDAAARRLREQSWVDSVEVKPQRLIVHLHDPNPHQLNAFLVGAGYQIAGIIPRRRTLREYFLKAMNS